MGNELVNGLIVGYETYSCSRFLELYSNTDNEMLALRAEALLDMLYSVGREQPDLIVHPGTGEFLKITMT